jgi:hypothetical protein
MGVGRDFAVKSTSGQTSLYTRGDVTMHVSHGRLTFIMAKLRIF